MSILSNPRHHLTRTLFRGAVAVGCALLLSGCVMYPARPYGYAPGYYYGGPPMAVYGGGWGYGRGWR